VSGKDENADPLGPHCQFSHEPAHVAVAGKRLAADTLRSAIANVGRLVTAPGAGDALNLLHEILRIVERAGNVPETARRPGGP
jgi:hypothetical protein